MAVINATSVRASRLSLAFRFRLSPPSAVTPKNAFELVVLTSDRRPGFRPPPPLAFLSPRINIPMKVRRGEEGVEGRAQISDRSIRLASFAFFSISPPPS